MYADALPGDPPLPVVPPSLPTPADRAMASLEVILCSDFPTQLLLALIFGVFGFSPVAGDGQLQLGFIVMLSLVDTLLLLGLIWLFVLLRGDRPKDIFLGGRPAWPEARAGLRLIPVAFLIAAIALFGARAIAPWLHNVETNPLQQLLKSPLDAALFGVVAVVAGGIREELQRAFLLNRFERWLGGGTIGVIVASTAFGAGHLIQGFDAALTTALLGAFWAVIYLRRRSVMAPMVSHAGFNLLQLLQIMAIGR